MARVPAVSPCPRLGIDERSRSKFATQKSTPAAPRFRADRSRVARCETARPESAQYHALVAVAMGPLALKETALRLTNAETDKVTDIVKHSRRDQNETIEAIQQSTMPRDEFRRVLET